MRHNRNVFIDLQAALLSFTHDTLPQASLIASKVSQPQHFKTNFANAQDLIY